MINGITRAPNPSEPLNVLIFPGMITQELHRLSKDGAQLSAAEVMPLTDQQRPRHRRAALERAQSSTCSEMLSASSTSIPR